MAALLAIPVMGGTAAAVWLYQWYKYKKEEGERRKENEMRLSNKNLRTELMTAKTDSSGDEINFRFLVFGITGHGKSTLCCGLKSALQDDMAITDYFHAGAGRGCSFTKGFTPAHLTEHLCLIDMGGIFESHLFTDENIRRILEGRIPFYAKLTAYLENVDPQIQVPPEVPNDISCLVIVMKPNTQITPEMRNKFRVVDDLAAHGHISRLLVITHVEQIDQQFMDPRNLVNLDTSQKVQQCRQQMSNETGIPTPYISFVRNYYDATETNEYSDFLLLKLLKRMIQSGVGTVERSLSKRRMKRGSYQ